MSERLHCRREGHQMDDDLEPLDYASARPKRTRAEQVRAIVVLVGVGFAVWLLWHVLMTFAFGWGPAGLKWR